MTFVICLFIFLMQFIWRYMDELIGKGLDTSIIIELLMYATVGLVPQSLPISILLASLMTFGNLGESFELISMKAAGISLLQIMKPLIIFMLFVCVGVFMFQDIVVPEAQKKMFALLISVKRKAPELEIPAGSFYTQIDGYNLYVKQKTPETGLLEDVMIYDLSSGFDNATVIVADSGYLKMGDDKQSLMFNLYNGELFENLKKQRSSKENVPYRRESFEYKTILIPFDATFNRMDDSNMQDQHVSKNRRQLLYTADSLGIVTDSMKHVEGTHLARNVYFSGARFVTPFDSVSSALPGITELSFDSVMHSLSYKKQAEIINKAIGRATTTKQDLQSRNFQIIENDRVKRRHEIEWHRKYTLSFACLIFFFIGAPLGAIIRKGGLGMPVVISVFLFLFYHIIDNTNYKMARDGIVAVWQGTWTSSIILIILGIFFTYKALNDSTILNADTYINFFKRLFGKRSVRNYERKEVIIFETDYQKVYENIQFLNRQGKEYLKSSHFPGYISFWKSRERGDELYALIEAEEKIAGELTNSREQRLIALLNKYPIIPAYRNSAPFKSSLLNRISGIFLPLGLIWYIQAYFYEKRAKKDISHVLEINQSIEELATSKNLINK
ncbi:MAG: LptF/LptG family permease [Candidatus Azobacteroides sp.]|nr:LptF/LptG family permease [Candidatus Azobacteroides sp.]